MRYLKVTVRNLDKEIKVAPAANLRQALLRNKVQIYSGLFKFMNCHGKGMCGSCTVRVVDNPAGLTDKSAHEAHKLRKSSPQARLACLAEVCDDIVIDTRKVDLDDADEMAQEARVARGEEDAADAKSAEADADGAAESEEKAEASA